MIGIDKLTCAGEHFDVADPALQILVVNVGVTVNYRDTHPRAKRHTMRRRDVQHLKPVLHAGVRVVVAIVLGGPGLELLQQLHGFNALVGVQCCNQLVTIDALRHPVDETINGQ